MQKKLLLVLFGLLAIALPFRFASAGVVTPIGYSVRSDGDGHLYTIDLMTGVATDMGLVGLGDAQGLEFVGSTLYGIGGTVWEFWDITTPPGSKIGDTGPRSGIDAGLGYDPTTGTMYNIQRDDVANLYEIDLTTGAATFIGQSDPVTPKLAPDGLAISDTGVAYAASTDSLYTVDLATGKLTLVGTFPEVWAECGLSFDSGGTLWGIFDNGAIYTFDTLTGASTFVSQVTLGGTPIGGFESLAILCVPSQVIPDVPWGTVMSTVAMMVGLIAYIGTKHTHILRRP